MSTCEKTSMRVQAALEHTLGKHDLSEYRLHLKSCSRCATLHADAAVRAAVSARSPDEDESLDLWPELERRIGGLPIRTPRLRALPLRWPLWSAAALVLLAVGAWTSHLSSDAPDKPPLTESLVASGDEAVASYDQAAEALRQAISARGNEVARDESLWEGLALAEGLVAEMRTTLEGGPDASGGRDHLLLALKHRGLLLQAIELTTRDNTAEGS